MKKNRSAKSNVTRRKFIKVMGASSAGLLVNPAFPSRLFSANSNYNATVATARVTSYDETLLKQAVEQSFSVIGGVGDIIKSGDTVGIKINLTGGSQHADKYENDTGNLAVETYWTHPTLLKVVGQAVKDAGASKLYFLEALYDWGSINNFGFKEVADYLGATVIDLNAKTPYPDYIQKPVGDDYLIYNELTLNGIFNDLDCYISMPKAKQHASAGITHGLKNQIGILPIPSGIYNDGKDHRAGIHNRRDYDGNTKNNLCRVMLDINRANPIHLVVNDAIKTVLGSEGPWTGPGIIPANFNKIITGKDPVAVDSVSTNVMHFDPMAEDYIKPFYDSLNYLKLATEEGLGEYDLSKIEVIDTATSVEKEMGEKIPNSLQLNQNYPNPFNPSTTIKYSVPKSTNVNLTVYNSLGQEVMTLVNKKQAAGTYEVRFDAGNLSSGVYLYKLKSDTQRETRRMMLVK